MSDGANNLQPDQTGSDTENQEGGATGASGAGEPGGAEQGGGLPDLPQHFLGETDQDTISNLYKAYQGLRETGAPKPPEKAEAYEFSPAEPLQGFFGDLDQDPLFLQAREAAHKHGLSNDQFQGFVNDTFAKLIEEGQIDPPYNPAAELDSLGQMLGTTSPKDLEKVVLENEVFAQNLAGQLGLQGPAASFLSDLTDLAGGNAFLHSLKGLMSERGLTVAEGGKTASPGALSIEDLKKLDRDDRINPRSKDYDPQLRKQYDEAYRRLYG